MVDDRARVLIGRLALGGAVVSVQSQKFGLTGSGKGRSLNSRLTILLPSSLPRRTRYVVSGLLRFSCHRMLPVNALLLANDLQFKDYLQNTSLGILHTRCSGTICFRPFIPAPLYRIRYTALPPRQPKRS